MAVESQAALALAAWRCVRASYCPGSQRWAGMPLPQIARRGAARAAGGCMRRRGCDEQRRGVASRLTASMLATQCLEIHACVFCASQLDNKAKKTSRTPSHERTAAQRCALRRRRSVISTTRVVASRQMSR